jgi:hypothetical protein
LDKRSSEPRFSPVNLKLLTTETQSHRESKTQTADPEFLGVSMARWMKSLSSALTAQPEDLVDKNASPSKKKTARRSAGRVIA